MIKSNELTWQIKQRLWLLFLGEEVLKLLLIPLHKLFWSSETNGNFLIVCCPSKSPISIYLPKVLQCYGYIDPYKFPHYTLTICQTNLLQNCSKKCDNLIYTSSVQMNIYFGLNQIVKFYLSNQN